MFDFVSLCKGAALHTHSISLGSIKWIVSNLTYWDGLYMKYENATETLEFAWFQKSPLDGKWHNVNEARRIFGKVAVDNFLTKHLSCDVELTQYSNINEIWQRFGRSLVAIRGLIHYLPAFNAYLYTALGKNRTFISCAKNSKRNMKQLYNVNV